VDTLDAALTLWATRDDTKPQPDVRRAANAAIDTIDALLRDLYLLRGRLTGEIRAADDAAGARADALLARRRAGLAYCGRCAAATRPVPCPACGGPACEVCGGCPACDGAAAGGVS
jgi:hypothetical protein